MSENRMLSDEILLALIKKNSGGGGGTNNYNDLSNQPQINGNTLVGDKSASNLGLVAAETGKGLSTNDYTDDDKAIVGGVTAALAGKQNTLTAGDYIQFDGNEISVKRDISKEDSRVVVNVYGHNDSVIDVTVTQDGEQISSETYSLHTLSTVNIANVAELYTPRYPFIAVKNLVDSTDHPAGYVEEMWMGNVPRYEQTYIVKAYEDKKLIIQAELDAEIDDIKDGTNIDSFADVETALALKQDKTDNALQTTDKTVVGAINEHEGDIDSLKSGLTNLDNEVNGDAATYPYADVITIEDAVPSNLADCSVKIEPVQDLHGYDKPWVGGAGKNKLWCTREVGTKSHLGGTIITNADGTIELDGTFSENFTLIYNDSLTLPSGSYKLNGGITDGSMTITNVGSTYNTDEYAFTLNSDYSGSLTVYITARQYNHAIIKPMIRLATETDATFAPYTNICHITGHTEVDVQRDGKNLLNPTKFARKNPDSGEASNNWAIWEDYIRCNYNDSFTLNCGIGHVQIYRIIVSCFDKYMNHLGNISETYIYGDGYTFTINIAGTKYCRVQLYNANSMAGYDFSTAQLELGQTATPYEPYAGKTYTIALGSTIYGGTVDFDSGVMTVDRAVIEYDGSEDENWLLDEGTHNFFYIELTGRDATKAVIANNCVNASISKTTTDLGVGTDARYLRYRYANDNSLTVSDLKTFLASNNLQVCYYIATPTTIQLTPQQIQLLKGQNTITASTGDISVTANGVSGAIGSIQTQTNGLTRAIGWDDARNIFNGIIRQGYVSNTTGEYVDSATRWVCTTKQECKENTTYTISASSSFLTRKIIVIYLDSNDTIISFSDFDHEASPVNINATITTPDNTAYIIVNIANQRNADGYNITPSDVWNVQIEEGTQITPYIPYHPVIGTAVEELLERVPDAPTTDGTYTLTVTVASGVPTYSWVSGS